MYRLVLYYLIFLIMLSALLGALGLIPYDPVLISISAALFIIFCLAVNTVFSKIFEAPTNLESGYITALILSLLIVPVKNTSDIFFYFWVSVWAIASKYLMAIHKKHIFNPVALAIVLTALTINRSAAWWVGNSAIFPAVLLGGYLLVRKIKREDLIVSFLISSFSTIAIFSFMSGNNVLITIEKALFNTPIIFFAFVMLTEPLTTPPARILRVAYGLLVGLLFSPQIHLGNFYFTPELALLCGNLFSYAVSPKDKLLLTLKEKIQLAPDIYDFMFSINKKLRYLPGQYMEWTLPHESIDIRGNRRYFTLASSPTEDTIRIGLKFYNPASSFKKSMLALSYDEPIVASQLAGDFTLPKDPNKKLVFIAGGIGITPFRSIIKYLLDRHETRIITLIYANKTAEEVVYRDIFDKAERELGLKAIYSLSDTNKIPLGWQGIKGKVTGEILASQIPDYLQRFFYLSGPRAMVLDFEGTLADLGVSRSRIITDYFPGFA